MARLRDAVLPVTLGTPKADFTYVDLTSVDSRLKAITGARTLSPEEAPSRARQHLEVGDVLVSTVRPNLNSVAQVSEAFHGAVGSTGFTVLRPNPERIVGAYLFHWVRSASFIDELVRRATGASYPAVSDSVVKDSDIPLPPLPEQRRIAAILDKLDEVKLRHLKRIDMIGDLADSMFVQMVREGGSETVRFGDALKLRSGKFLPASSQDGSGNIAVYGGNGVNGHHSVSMFEVPQIVIGRVGAYCGVVHVTQGPSWVTDNAMVVHWEDAEFDLDFLAAALENANLNQFASQSGQPLISAARLENVELPLVPLSQQRRFGQRTRQTQQLAKVSRESLAKLDELFASLQRRAFNGHLSRSPAGAAPPRPAAAQPESR